MTLEERNKLREAHKKNRKYVVDSYTIETEETATFYYFSPIKKSKSWDYSNIESVELKCRKLEDIIEYSDGEKVIKDTYWRNMNKESCPTSPIRIYDNELNNIFISGVKMVRTDNDREAYIEALKQELMRRREDALRAYERFGGYIEELEKQL